MHFFRILEHHIRSTRASVGTSAAAMALAPTQVVMLSSQRSWQ
jgi:hypothetical protein